MASPVVLITGALTGIGRAAGVVFAKEGSRVVVSGRRDKQGQELVAELQTLGAEAFFVRTDVRKDDDVRDLVDQVIKRFGRLDIAVNNAGTEGLPGLVTEQTAESYAATFDTNVLGVLLRTRAAGNAAAGKRKHRQYLIDLTGVSRCRCVRLCGQQNMQWKDWTKSAALEKLRTAGSRVKRNCCGHHGYWHAHPLHQHGRK